MAHLFAQRLDAALASLGLPVEIPWDYGVVPLWLRWVLLPITVVESALSSPHTDGDGDWHPGTPWHLRYDPQRGRWYAVYDYDRWWEEGMTTADLLVAGTPVRRIVRGIERARHRAAHEETALLEVEEVVESVTARTAADRELRGLLR